MDIRAYPVLRDQIRELKKSGMSFMTHVRMVLLLTAFTAISLSILAVPASEEVSSKIGIGDRIVFAVMMLYCIGNIRDIYRNRKAAAESRVLLKKNLRMTDYEARSADSIHNILFMRSALIARTSCGLVYLPYENISRIFRDDAYLNQYAAVIAYDRDDQPFEVYMRKRSEEILKERDAVYRRLRENCERRGVSPEGSYVNFRGKLPALPGKFNNH